MEVIEHGDWVVYIPDPLPEYLPVGVLFAKRESDDMDWYDYIQGTPVIEHEPAKVAEKQRTPPKAVFVANSVKATVYWHEGFQHYYVGSAVYDVTMLFPGGNNGTKIIEIADYTGTDPATDFNSKIYDPLAKTFSEFDTSTLKGPLDPLIAQIAELTKQVEELRKQKLH